MIDVLKYLIIIRLRKWVSKDDYLAYFLLVVPSLLSAFVFYFYFEEYKNFIFLYLLDIIIQHTNRTDLSFLKRNKNYKFLLFFEYLIYLFPALLVLLLKLEGIYIAVFLLFDLLLINLPKISFKVIAYPFDLFNVFWHVTFRKYKLLFIYPVFFLLGYVFYLHKNENILIFCLLLVVLFSCIPSFEREKVTEIIINPFNSKRYLLSQIKNTLINTLVVVLPVVFVFTLLKWEMLVYLIPVFVFSITATLVKYNYFDNIMLQQLVFVLLLVLSITLFGLPMLLIPYLYKKAILNINSVKYVRN